MSTPLYQVIAGDCRLALRGQGPFDAVVTDPPYELGFMGKSWDKTQVPFQAETWATIGAAMKPGAFLLAFGAPRTWHRLACAIEDAGFELRDQLCWLSAYRMPKGKGQLKPCWEPILVARKPLQGTEEANLAVHGTGRLQTDACRLASGADHREKCASVVGLAGPNGDVYAGWDRLREDSYDERGRWPGNVVLTHDEACVLLGTRRVPYVGGKPDPGQSESAAEVYGWATSGEHKKGRIPAGADGCERVEVWECAPGCPVALLDASVPPSRSRQGKPRGSAKPGEGWGMTKTGAEYDDAGGPSRFFFCGRASAAEKQAGLGELRNDHKTVKPIALMRWLVRLVTPSGGVVLDPFCGSGSTGCAAALEGFGFVGMDSEAHNVDIARRRIAHWAGTQGVPAAA